MIIQVLIFAQKPSHQKEKEQLERMEMRMLQWTLEISMRDRKKIEDIHKSVGVAFIPDIIRDIATPD